MKGVYLIVLVAVLGGCWGIKSLLVVKPLPPHAGAVEMRMAPETSTGTMVFQMDYHVHDGMTPESYEVDEMKAKGRELGANVIILQCGGAGTVGQGWCKVMGYSEVAAAGPAPS